MQPAVARAIALLRDRYAEPITLEDLSAEVFVSPFHLARVFRRATGVTPGRFLTAVRLFEAKRLLLTTTRTVSDIVGRVGYRSLGSFTSRFTAAVGMTPSQYRDPEVRELLLAVSSELVRLPRLVQVSHRTSDAVTGTIAGTIDVPSVIAPANVLVGVFDERIPQCGPVAFQTLPATAGGTFEITDVPPGRWTLLAVAEHRDRTAPPHLAVPADDVTTSAGTISTVHIGLRRVLPTDPPIAVTLFRGRQVATRPLRVA